MRAGPKRVPTRKLLPKRRTQLASPADEVVRFFKTRLTHQKGDLAGRPLVLAPWQINDIVTPLFNRRNPDGSRQIRTCYVEVPRKNAKSTLAAGLALYMLYEDNEPGAEIVSAASDREQAAIVFDIARGMVENNPILASMTQIYRRELVVPANDARPWESRYKVISSEAYSKHGMNLHCAIIDEVHAHQDGGELWSVLTKCMAARRQPLTFAITTAGYDKTETSLCWTLHDRAMKVATGQLIDPSFHGVIYAAPADMDWRDSRAWEIANPGLGTSVRRDFLERECRQAQDMPAYYQNEFRRYHLDQWTESASAWLSMAKWDLGAVPVDADALAGRPCFAGLDMSTNTDLSALVLVFPAPDGAGYDVLPFAWCPREGIRRRSQRDHAPYDDWLQRGFLEATPGDAVDQEVVRERLHELRTRYDIREIGYDDWNMGYLGPKLLAGGFTMVPLRQTFKGLSGATKHLERCALKGLIRHGGHPVLRWCIANTVVETDGPENVKPSKRKSTERIDLTIALVMALARSMTNEGPSVYETRGVRIA